MIAKSALKHRKLNQAILNLAILELRASDTLERGTMFVEIVEGLVPSETLSRVGTLAELSQSQARR